MDLRSARNMLPRMLKRLALVAALAAPVSLLPALEARADVAPRCKCEAPGASLGTNAAVVGGIAAVGGIAVFAARRKRR